MTSPVLMPLPGGMKHYEESGRNHGNGMTFVDIVFPAFLFITGLSVPLAVEARRRKGDSWVKIWFHILLRTASLLFLGVLMVNNPSDKRMGWPHDLWDTLMYSFAIGAFLSLPLKSDRAKNILMIVRCVGVAALLCLGWVFKDKHGHHIDHDWWGILGLIGWAYLVVCLVAIPLGFNRSFMLMTLPLLMCLFFAERARVFDDWWIGDQVGIGGTLGSQGAIAMAGAILGSLLVGGSDINSPKARLMFVFIFSIALAIGGLLLEKTYGTNKNAATPTWCLYSAAATCTLWGILYLVIDVIGFRFWAIPLAWSGASVLLIYLLHPLQYFVFELFHWEWYGALGEGSNPMPGIIRSLCMAAFLSLIAGLLYRKGVTLRL